MRVVFDTNVLVSAVLFGGLPRLALEFAVKGDLVPVTSIALMDEFDRVLRIKFRLSPNAADVLRREYQHLAKLVKPKIRLTQITADPADNRVLECAVEGKADAIVSGDRHLLRLKSFRDIPVMTVREFVDMIHR